MTHRRPTLYHETLARLMAGLLTVVAVGASAGPAALEAQEEEEGAPRSFDDLDSDDRSSFDKHLRRCTDAYNDGKFEKAERYCGEAIALVPHPAARYVIARIRHRSNACEDAVAVYEGILDEEPAGDSEAKWIKENREKIEGHRGTLGNCKARYAVACDEADAEDAYVLVDGALVGRGCPTLIETTPGEHTVTLIAPGKAPASQREEVEGGAPVELSWKALEAHEAEEGTRVACPDFPDGAVLSIDGDPLGFCPDTFALAPGRHVLKAEALDGDALLSGALTLDVPDTPPASLDVPRAHPITLTCADPEIALTIERPTFADTVTGTCGELAAAGGLILSSGDYTLLASRETYIPAELPLTIDGADTFEVPRLEREPVEITVTCEGDTSDDPIAIRIDDAVGPCPLTAMVSEGSHTIDARQSGHAPLSLDVEVVHGQENTVSVPPLEETSFFTAGTVTTMAGGAFLVAAVAIDAAGASDLQAFKDVAAAGEDIDRYNTLRDTVETNILLTRIFYGVSAAALITGGALIIYEVVSADPGDFSDESARRDEDDDGSRVLITPAFIPSAEGSSPGVGVLWTF